VKNSFLLRESSSRQTDENGLNSLLVSAWRRLQMNLRKGVKFFLLWNYKSASNLLGARRKIRFSLQKTFHFLIFFYAFTCFPACKLDGGLRECLVIKSTETVVELPGSYCEWRKFLGWMRGLVSCGGFGGDGSGLVEDKIWDLNLVEDKGSCVRSLARF
jgi:hypothetical protein